jgi:hypothetical protein
VALGALVAIALLVPARFVTRLSCADQAKTMSCCAEAPSDCPALPAPCCRLTRPLAPAPALLTAQSAPQMLMLSGAVGDIPACLAPVAISPDRAQRPRAHSSPPLFVLHAALLI